MAGPAAPPRITPWYIRTYDLRFFQNMACILRRGGYNEGMKDIEPILVIPYFFCAVLALSVVALIGQTIFG